jgi:uncharacterized membrane protein YeaQ/YmgE (transglycosylase-associated protein family)
MDFGMFGMDFTSFIILLIISVVISAVLHFPLQYYVTAGWWSFASKVIVGWVGAWLGTPIFGRWLDGLNYENVYYIPAILGSLALLILAVDMGKMFAGKK